MTITYDPAAEAIVGWARQQQALAKEYGDENAASAIAEAIARFRENKFVLTVLGKAKRGKSTLINALLGRRDDLVAPIDKLPASSAITRISWAETQKVVVHFRDGHMQEIGFNNIREYVTEELNPENRKGVNQIEVVGPFPGLDHDLILVDTPGAGSIHEYHDQILQEFIPQSDAVLYLVTARMALDQDEVDLLKKVQASEIKKVLFAMNKVDATSLEDIVAAEQHNGRVLQSLGISVSCMHRISAKRAFDGDLAASGLANLFTEINTLLSEGKGKFLRARLAERVQQIMQPLRQAASLQVIAAGQTAAERQQMLGQLADRKTQLESRRELVERRFTHVWKTAVDVFEADLPAAQRTVAAAIKNKIQNSGLLAVSGLAKDLPTLITKSVDEHLGNVATKLESQAKRACTELRVDYPVLQVEAGGSIAVATQKSEAGFLYMGAGVATAAAGVGVAAAAATAATAAAATVATATTVAPLAAGLAGVVGYVSPWLAAGITSLGTSTTAVAASAPLWCAVAGPVGWAVAGLGALVVPLAWRRSRLRSKEQLQEAAGEQIASLFQHLQRDRVPALRRLGESIIEEFRIKSDAEIAACQQALRKAGQSQTPADLNKMRDLESRLNAGAVPPGIAPAAAQPRA